MSIGQEFILRCAARGYPAPNITWTFNDNPAQDHPELSVLPSGELSIKRVVGEHGEHPFVCTAENVHGSSQGNVYLNVVTKTTIIKGPVDTTAQVGSFILLQAFPKTAFTLTVEARKLNLFSIQMVDGVRFVFWTF